MKPRLVIRHDSIFSSPKALATELGVLTRVPTARKPGDYSRDFFMAYPPTNLVRSGGSGYATVAEFFASSKGQQRLLLGREGLPVPQTRLGLEPLSGQQFVVRPLRHQGGSHFRTTTRTDDFVPGHEYISELFPKTHEYRVIFVFGQPVVVLRKKAHEGVVLRADQPWNHGNTVFQTIAKPGEGKLAVYTDAYIRLLDNPVIRSSHYCGADILYDHTTRRYVVCELNSSPALQIEENRKKVAEFILAH